jgi:hypothetical protein
MRNPVFFVINMLIMELKWSEVVSQEITDVPQFYSGHSAARNDVGP